MLGGGVGGNGDWRRLFFEFGGRGMGFVELGDRFSEYKFRFLLGSSIKNEGKGKNVVFFFVKV